RPVRASSWTRTRTRSSSCSPSRLAGYWSRCRAPRSCGSPRCVPRAGCRGGVPVWWTRSRASWRSRTWRPSRWKSCGKPGKARSRHCSTDAKAQTKLGGPAAGLSLVAGCRVAACRRSSSRASIERSCVGIVFTSEAQPLVTPSGVTYQRCRVLQQHSQFCLEPGEKLPSGPQLAKRYGVARLPVQQAIRVLRDEGLVISRQGSGVFVRARTERPVGLRPHLERAFTEPHVSIDFVGFSGETLHGAIAEPLDKIRAGALMPESITLRILVPDPARPWSLPSRVEDMADSPAFRTRARRTMERHTEAVVDAVDELGKL